MKKIFRILIALLPLSTYGGVVGDFSKTQNLPGFIDLDPESIAFKGPNIRNIDRNDGVITETPSALIASFMINGRINTSKIEDVIREIRTFQENARIAYCQSKQAEDDNTQIGCREGFPKPKLAKKWEQKSVNIALTYAQKLLERAINGSAVVTEENINTSVAQPFLADFFDAFEIYQGVVQDSAQIGKYSGLLGNMYSTLKEAARSTTINRHRVEASNLLRADGQGNVFYSPEELTELKSQGVDISRLDPPDSGFWRKPRGPISTFDTSNYNKEDIPYLEKVHDQGMIKNLLDSETPIDVEYEVEPPKGTGETAKINVLFGKTTYKVKFVTDRQGLKTDDIYAEAMKVLQGAEVNTETVVNNLAAALGFTVDGTYYKDRIRVFFPNKVYEKDGFDKEYEKMYKMLTERWAPYNNTGSALRSVKIDEKTGRKYLELRHVQLERKSSNETDMNIGSFARKGLGKSMKREHRGFALFLAWVWDVDAKDLNNALKLVPYTENGELRYKVVLSNSDMGSTLGSSRPNIYNFNLVNYVEKDHTGEPEFIKFNYLKVYTNDVLDAMSFDDAKWIARLIGQLTVKQIHSAFRAAGYSDPISQYYTGLMLKKRNQLLEALNLLGHEIQPLPEFNGTIEGLEEFFYNGQLTDPDNKLWDPEKEPFAPSWGASIRNLNEGEPQTHFIKVLKLRILSIAGDIVFDSYLGQTSIGTQGLKFEEIVMPSTSSVDGCKGACFFQGFTAGVEGIIPWRFVVSNPDKESKMPYLIVDLFRLGFFVGTNLQSAFGVGIPTEIALGIGTSHYQISEYIKVRPVDDLSEIFDEKLDLITMPKLNLRTARAKLIEGLKENEYLIQSHYLGLKAKVRLSPYTGWFLPVLPSITFRGDVFTANRVTYKGTTNQGLLVGWDKLKQFEGGTRLNAIDLIVRLPILDGQIRRLNNVQRTFEFDRSKEEDRKVLFDNVNKILPSDIPAQYALAKRTTNLFERSLSVGIFNFIRRTSTRRSVSVDYEEPAKAYVASSTNYIREIDRTKFTRTLGTHSSNYKIQASINSQKEIFAKVKLLGHFDNMNRHKFKKVLKKYDPLLPENFIQFDPESVNDNFGTLELELETIFPEAGLKKIFDKNLSKFSLCKVYAQVHEYDWDDEDCAYLTRFRFGLIRGITGGRLRFIRLWNNYLGVRNAFWELSENRNSEGHISLKNRLKKVVDLLTDRGNWNYRVMNLFIALSGSANYYRRAKMISNLESFPGQVSNISEDVGAAGIYRPSQSMKAENPEEEFELFSDKLHNALRSLFYSGQYANNNVSY
jgi:hypothetical protein